MSFAEAADFNLNNLNWSQIATTSRVVLSRTEALTRYRRRQGERHVSETNEPLEPLISTIRGRRVVLDADLARLYGVTTKRFNEAFKRNRHRFPGDFAFQISADEFGSLRSQFATSNQAIDSSGVNRSQFATGSSLHRNVSFRPWAFTEHGALMAANILRSERAVQMSIFVVRAFIRLREQVAANTAVVARLAEIDKKLLEHDVALLELRIGFHTDDE
jgi:ORF6N domain-containing protein